MLSDADIERCLLRYERERPRYEQLARLVDTHCRTVVDEVLAVRTGVSWRLKGTASLRNKIIKNRASYASVDDFFAQISDLAGVRITTYREQDRGLVAEALQLHFAPPPAGQVFVEVKDKTGFAHHYRAIHVQAGLRDEWLNGDAAQLRGMSCEIQVCSLLAHVYNEVEHDLQYKQLHGSLSERERDLLEELGQLTLRGDSTIDTLLQATLARQIGATGPFQDVHDFVARMAQVWHQAHDFARHAPPLFALLQSLGLHTPQAVMARAVDDVALMRLFGPLAQRVQTQDVAPLDPRSADVLLVALLPRLAPELLAACGPRKTHGQASRVATVARVYLELSAADDLG